MIGKIRVISGRAKAEMMNGSQECHCSVTQGHCSLSAAAVDITFHEISRLRQYFWFSVVALAADGT